MPAMTPHKCRRCSTTVPRAALPLQSDRYLLPRRLPCLQWLWGPGHTAPGPLLFGSTAASTAQHNTCGQQQYSERHMNGEPGTACPCTCWMLLKKVVGSCDTCREWLSSRLRSACAGAITLPPAVRGEDNLACEQTNLDRPAHLVAPLVHTLAGSWPAGAGPGLQSTSRVRGVLVGTHALPSKQHEQTGCWD